MLTSTSARTPPTDGTDRRVFRVLYVVSHAIQYQAPLLRRLARHPCLDLQVAFHDDLACTRFHDPGFDRYIEWDVPLLTGYRHTFLARRGGRRNRPAQWLRARALITSGHYDALWLHGHSSALHWYLAALARRRGLAVLLRGENAALPTSPRRPAWKAALLAALVRRADALLAIGTANARFYRQLGARPHQLFPMPYAVDNVAFRRRARLARRRRLATRRALGIAADRPILLYCGKLEQRKRPLDLIAAMHRLQALPGPRPCLLIAGDGVLREQVARAAGTIGDSVRLLGFVGQRRLPALYDLCDALVLPSAHEPWGLVVNEAMSIGRPAIVSDRVGCAEDLVVHGESGLVVPLGDVEQLAESMARIAGDRAAARRMGRCARRRLAAISFAADEAGLLAALRTVVR